MAENQRELTVGAYEAKTRFSELLQKVEGGETVTVTRHGRPIARLVPTGRRHSVEERRAAIRRIRELSSGVSLGSLTIKDLINEGRP